MSWEEREGGSEVEVADMEVKVEPSRRRRLREMGREGGHEEVKNAYMYMYSMYYRD